MYRLKPLAAFALLVSSFATEAARANEDNDVFAPLKNALWRPVQSAVPLPQITMQFGHNSFIASTSCVQSGLSFRENDNVLTFEGQNSSDEKRDPTCRDAKPSLSDISGLFSKTSTVEFVNGSPTLRDRAEQPIVTLKKISPDGIEFRDLVVKAYRYDGKLSDALYPSGTSKFVLYDGWMAGSFGCGGISGSTYTKPNPSEFEFQITSVLIGYCESAAWKQDKKIIPAFKGTLKVAAQGTDFVLRDEHDRVQLILSPFASK